MPLGLSFAGSAAAGRDCVVVGGTMFSSYVTRYDSSQRAWVPCRPLTTPRIHSAVAALDGCVVATGGRSQVTQCTGCRF